jgi:S-adenosylmethionine-diacylgycerolhomoserine-N-methlytransferase
MNSNSTPSTSVPAHPANGAHPLAGYYRWHASIYDHTRWAFLFGRPALVRRVAAHLAMPQRILEIGCGTGSNLLTLAHHFPKARILGLDLSRDMLDRARAKVRHLGGRVGLLHRAYDAPVAVGGGFDLIVLSYSLSMMNPGYEEVLRLCCEDLGARGLIAVVDFHETRHAWFRRWMGLHHVRMEGQVLHALKEGFEPLETRVGSGYGGLWQHLTFIGRARPSAEG